ncbi:MAG: hypothetical protein V1767_09240 [Chloroflexota bacterium]
MTKPNISELRKVLTEQDWQWSPHFRITPLKVADIRRVISDFYAAVDKAIGEYEESLKKNLANARPPSWEREKLRCRDVLMTYTHVGIRKPFAVRHRRLLEELGIYGLWRKYANLWYFAIAWQFKEWYDHILEIYEDKRYRQLDNLTQEAEQFEGGLGESLTLHFLEKQIDLLENKLDNLVAGEEQEWYHRNLFLDVWLHLHGIELNASEKDDVLDLTFNRFGDNIHN